MEKPPPLFAARDPGKPQRIDVWNTPFSVGSLHQTRERRLVVEEHRRAFLESMITVGNLRNGSTYLTQHLRKNDYWAEGENEIRGEWIGEGAKALGLSGE